MLIVHRLITYKKQSNTELTLHSNITRIFKTFSEFFSQQITKWYTGLFEKWWYIRTLLRALQAGIENANQVGKNSSRLLRKNLGSFMWVSTVYLIERNVSYNIIYT